METNATLEERQSADLRPTTKHVFLLTFMVVAVSAFLIYQWDNNYMGTKLELLIPCMENVCEWFENFFRNCREFLRNIRIQNSTTATDNSPSAQSWAAADQLLQSHLLALQAKYKQQFDNTWFQIYSAISSTLSESAPSQPATIILLSTAPSTVAFSACLAQEIGTIVNQAFDKANGVDGTVTHSPLQISPDSLRMVGSVDDIHDKFNEYLSSRGKAVIVHKFEKVNIMEHLFVFHAYCDNFDAIDQRANFIFLVNVPPGLEGTAAEILSNGENAGAQELAELVLQGAWNSLTNDKRPAIISRVASHVVVVQPGDSCVDG